jgi:hypothetical protein
MRLGMLRYVDIVVLGPLPLDPVGVLRPQHQRLGDETRIVILVRHAMCPPYAASFAAATAASGFTDTVVTDDWRQWASYQGRPISV